MTRVLVTGAAGFLGRQVVQRLLAKPSHHVRALVRSREKGAQLEYAVHGRHAGRLEVVVGNLASAECAGPAVRGCDVVYHLAASLRGAPADIFVDTVVATRNLLDALRIASPPPKLVHVSSFGVYGVASLGRGARIDERTPLEPHPARRDPYSFAKWRQEALVREYAAMYGVPTVILRPGVVYGPSGPAFSTRVGLDLLGVFLHLGGENELPITYVQNCADAVVIAGHAPEAVGEIYNVVDDGRVTAARWLALYKKRVRPVPSLRIPYPVLEAVSRAVLRYHVLSKGQLPAIFTPYKTASTWGGNRFDNRKLVALGWQPRVSTDAALAATFDDLRDRIVP